MKTRSMTKSEKYNVNIGKSGCCAHASSKFLKKRKVLDDGRCGYRAYLLAAHKTFPANVNVQFGKNSKTRQFLTERRSAAATAFRKFYKLTNNNNDFSYFDIDEWYSKMSEDDAHKKVLSIDKYTDENLLLGFSLLYGTSVDIYNANDLHSKPFRIEHPFNDNAESVSICYEDLNNDIGHFDALEFTNKKQKN